MRQETRGGDPYWCREVVVGRKAELCCALACLEKVMSSVSQDQEMRAQLHMGAVYGVFVPGKEGRSNLDWFEFFLFLEVIATSVRKMISKIWSGGR